MSRAVTAIEMTCDCTFRTRLPDLPPSMRCGIVLKVPEHLPRPTSVIQRRFDGEYILRYDVSEGPRMVPIDPVPFKYVDDHTLFVAYRDLTSRHRMSGAPSVLVVDDAAYTDPFFVGRARGNRLV